MKKPIVGVPLAYQNPAFESKDDLFNGFSDYPFYALRVYEANAIYTHGATPLYLPYLWEDVNAYLDLCQGLVFAGGPEPFLTTLPSSQTPRDIHLTPQGSPGVIRTTFEWKLLEKALERDIPVLGICRGAQLLNEVCGGSLDFVDNLNSTHSLALAHWYKTPQDLAHPITVCPTSLLASCLGAEKNPCVNSLHNEAISKLGTHLKVSGQASDGIIEAIESTTHRWVVGVQWHPEFLITPFDSALFSSFIEACTQTPKA